MRLSTIALLTDFGLTDIYVGVMKGAIAALNPQATMIDLTHQLRPQDIRGGSFCLAQAYPYFPPGTIYVGVVDPGVGSQRRAIAIQLDWGYLVGPDNGLFTGILTHHAPITKVHLNQPRYWGTSDPSTTFHGRDIFAPVAAYLSLGVPITQLGTPVEDLVTLFPLPYQVTPQTRVGVIQYIDHFGNLITNIPGADLPTTWQVQILDLQIPSAATYASTPPNSLVALVGSHGLVEIAVNGGNAQQRLMTKLGDRVIVSLKLSEYP